jgi:hypothetical protein
MKPLSYRSWKQLPIIAEQIRWRRRKKAPGEISSLHCSLQSSPRLSRMLLLSDDAYDGPCVGAVRAFIAEPASNDQNWNNRRHRIGIASRVTLVQAERKESRPIARSTAERALSFVRSRLRKCGVAKPGDDDSRNDTHLSPQESSSECRPRVASDFQKRMARNQHEIGRPSGSGGTTFNARTHACGHLIVENFLPTSATS